MWKQRGRYEIDMLYYKVPLQRLYLTQQTIAFLINLSLYVNVNKMEGKPSSTSDVIKNF